MTNGADIIPAGRVFFRSYGSYADYGVDHAYQALRDIHIAEVSALITRYRPGDRYSAGRIGAFKQLVDAGAIKPIPISELWDDEGLELIHTEAEDLTAEVARRDAENGGRTK